MNEIYLASDHGGTVLKANIAAHLSKSGYDVRDLGMKGTESVDYPDYAASLAEAMQKDVRARGILFCGSGIGISIAANRFSHIRAALVTDVTAARLCRQHNDANMLSMGARVLGEGLALEIVDAFLSASFEGGRHATRVDMITAIEA